MKQISNTFKKPFCYYQDGRALCDSRYNIDESKIIYCRSQNLNPILKLKFQPRILNHIHYRSEKSKPKLKSKTQALNQSITNCRTQISNLSIRFWNLKVTTKLSYVKKDIKCNNNQSK